MKYVRSLQALRPFHGMPLLRRRPAAAPSRAYVPFVLLDRHFHVTAPLDRRETHILSDIGEGVKEVQIIQWFVEEGAPIEEWSPLCEVQSDKASVEITSKYTGIIKKIYHGQDDVVQVGEPIVDIEVEDGADATEEGAEQQPAQSSDTANAEQVAESGREATLQETKAQEEKATSLDSKPPGKHASLATPAVRGLLKEHGLRIEEIPGTGKDGRVLKEDVYRYLEKKTSVKPPSSAAAAATPDRPEIDAKQIETAQKLTPVQSAMFKSMTASLSIPHFLYSDTVDITNLASMRAKLNAARNPETTPKYTYLPFIVKAVSLALNKYPLLNARLDLTTDPKKPQLMMRPVHNIGIAMDTPNGLVVPVIKAVNARSIASIAQEIQRLSQLGQAGKLGNNDLTGGTITVSNIGSIGGDVVAPVIVESQLAIMGVGKVKTVPVFAEDGVTVKPAQVAGVSWSADHRVVDGATMARMAQVVQNYLQEPSTMVVDMC
ncbi:Lipoamide acyltransferase [Exophiala dermatitidis]